jgi:hypothetical protein
MQGRGDVPDDVIADEDGEDEHREVDDSVVGHREVLVSIRDQGSGIRDQG